MSDVFVGALIGALAALGGGVVTQVAGFVLEKRRELASYRVNLYERRLDIHQEAYKWLMDIIEPLQDAMSQHPHAEGETVTHSELARLSYKAREWWDANCLFLYWTSRSHVVDLIEVAKSVAECETVETFDTIKLYRDALRAVQEGIGLELIEITNPRKADAR